MTVDEYARHVARLSPVVWIDSVPWYMARGILEPLAMPHTMRPVDRAKVRQAMRATGARIARWNDAWDTAPCEWWWICCDNPDYDLETFSRNHRKHVRSALRRTEVRRIDAQWFAENAYEVYAAAFDRYGPERSPTSREEFRRMALEGHRFAGRETWGAFVDERLAAYMTCLVYDDVAIISAGKWDAAYRHAMPNNALEYVLTRHYLTERHLSYVTTGSRVVHHETQTQEFDLTLGYRQIYCPLRVEFSPLVKGVVRLGLHRLADHLGLARFAPGPMGKLSAVAALAKIARSCGDRSLSGIR